MEEQRKLTQDEIRARVDFLSTVKCNHTPHKYIDITGDLIQGTLLARILYWFGDGKGNTSKVRIYKDGHYWIAKQRSDWWDEIRITKRQFDRAIAGLKDGGFVITAKYKFNSMPTMHIRPNYEVIRQKIAEWEQNLALEIEQAETPVLHKAQDGNYEKCNSLGNYTKCNSGITESATPLTYITNNDDDNTANKTTNTSFGLRPKVYIPCSGMEAVNDTSGDAPPKPKKPSRHIPDDYTEEQLRDHVRHTIQGKYGAIEDYLGYDHDQRRMDMFEDILVAFFKCYERHTGQRHRILPDKTLEAAMARYIEFGEPSLDASLEAWEDAAEEYMEKDFGAKSDYDGEIERSFSHFMTEGVANLLIWRERTEKAER